VLSDQQLFIQEKKHKRLKRSGDQQPESSSQIGGSTIVIDCEKEIDKRQEEFIKVFVKKFEEKLEEYRKEAAVGGTPKSFKIREKIATPLGVVGGLVSGIPGAAVGGQKSLGVY
jgi:hypothetical protein